MGKRQMCANTGEGKCTSKIGASNNTNYK